MIEVIAETVIEFVPRTIGWAVLKVVTFGRYRGFRDDDRLVEGGVGLVAITVVCAVAYAVLQRSL